MPEIHNYHPSHINFTKSTSFGLDCKLDNKNNNNLINNGNSDKEFYENEDFGKLEYDEIFDKESKKHRKLKG